MTITFLYTCLLKDIDTEHAQFGNPVSEPNGELECLKYPPLLLLKVRYPAVTRHGNQAVHVCVCVCETYASTLFLDWLSI